VVQHCVTDLKWAVAGRSHTKLAALVEETKQLNVNRKPVDIVLADSSDLAVLRTLAKSTKVVVSFAGPFAKYDLVLLLTTDSETKSFKRVRKMGHIMWISLERLHGNCTYMCIG